MNTIAPETVIEFRKPANGQLTSYRPASEGYFILRFKPGVKREDLTLPPPFPAGSFLQLATGWVGKPQPTLEMAQRDLCEVHVRYPTVAHHVEICKCPCALAEAAAFVPLTDEPDPEILSIAKTVDWEWWLGVENYHQGKGKYAKA